MRDINRIYRIANEMQRNIAVILQFKIRDPRVVGIVTVLGLYVSKDISYAKVFIAFLNDDYLQDERDEKIKILCGAAGFIRSLLAKSMFLRVVPKLFFVYDNSVVESMRMYRLLNRIIF